MRVGCRLSAPITVLYAFTRHLLLVLVYTWSSFSSGSVMCAFLLVADGARSDFDWHRNLPLTGVADSSYIHII